jgi:spore maturation protein CgeB
MIKVLVLGNGTTAWQNGILIFLEAEEQGKNVSFCNYAGIPDEKLRILIAEEAPDWIFLTGIRSISLSLMQELASKYKLFVWDADAVDSSRDQLWKERVSIPHVVVNSTLDVFDRYNTLARKLVWVPQYYDNDYYSSNISRLNPNHEIWDVAFLGNSDRDNNRQEFLRRLKTEGFKCCIRGSNKAVDGSSSFVFGHDMADIYRQSKIVIDIRRKNFHYGKFTTSDRIFKAMGCGAFYLTFNILQIERLFVPGQHLDCYIDYNDMVNKIRFYLQNEELREKIAKAGCAEVHAKHLLRHRISQYWSLMENN